MGGHVGHRIDKSICAVTVLAFSGFLVGIDAQRRVAGQAQTKQGIQASIKVGGQTYQSNEPGKCTYAPTAAIYQVVSELWSVQQSSEGRSLALSLWKPKDGSATMITLSVSNGESSHQVNTVRGGGTTSGSGKVTFEKSGSGGTFTVDAKTANGASISGTIRCDAIAPHIAEGGL